MALEDQISVVPVSFPVTRKAKKANSVNSAPKYLMK